MVYIRLIKKLGIVNYIEGRRIFIDHVDGQLTYDLWYYSDLEKII